MKIDYTLLTIILGSIYAILYYYFPDFPVTKEVILAATLWALAQLGVEVVGIPVRNFLRKRGFIE